MSGSQAELLKRNMNLPGRLETIIAGLNEIKLKNMLDGTNFTFLPVS
jgi:hypothetical protein